MRHFSKLFNYFRFTRSEQVSISILCLIMIGVNLARLKFGEGNLPPHSLSMDTAEVFQDNRADAGTGFSKEEEHILVKQGSINKKDPVEINKADSSDLLDLFGIGPVFASRIVKFRNLLGGFHKPEQLLEVYGMDTIRYRGFIDKIRVDSSRVKKLNLNTSGFRDLLRHPYLDYEEVRSIVRFRDIHGPFLSPGQLWADSVLKPEKEEMLLPYLTVK